MSQQQTKHPDDIRFDKVKRCLIRHNHNTTNLSRLKVRYYKRNGFSIYETAMEIIKTGNR